MVAAAAGQEPDDDDRDDRHPRDVEVVAAEQGERHDDGEDGDRRDRDAGGPGPGRRRAPLIIVCTYPRFPGGKYTRSPGQAPACARCGTRQLPGRRPAGDERQARRIIMPGRSTIQCRPGLIDGCLTAAGQKTGALAIT
jgi:hypothetical protein